MFTVSSDPPTNRLNPLFTSPVRLGLIDAAPNGASGVEEPDVCASAARLKNMPAQKGAPIVIPRADVRSSLRGQSSGEDARRAMIASIRRRRSGPATPAARIGAGRSANLQTARIP